VAMVHALAGVAGSLPLPGQDALVRRLAKLGTPAPAHVFRIPDTGC
jgi:hypothetical protein